MVKAVKIFFFSLVLLFISDRLIWLSLDYLSAGVTQGHLMGKLNLFLKKNSEDPFKLIVLGSSRANHHLDPEFLSDNSFNMGLDGQKLAFHFGVLSSLDSLEQTIVLHLDPEELIGDPEPFENEVLRLSPQYFKNGYIRNYIDSYSQKEMVLNQIFHSRVYNGKIFSIIRNFGRSPNSDYTGYEPLNGLFCFDCEEEDKLKSTKLNAERLLLLENFINVARVKNKRLVIFSSPKCSDADKEDNLKLARFLSFNNVTYLDLTDSIVKDSCSYWKDNVHLSSAGAKVFNHIFKDKFRKSMIKKNRFENKIQ